MAVRTHENTWVSGAFGMAGSGVGMRSRPLVEEMSWEEGALGRHGRSGVFCWRRLGWAPDLWGGPLGAGVWPGGGSKGLEASSQQYGL